MVNLQHIIDDMRPMALWFLSQVDGKPDIIEKFNSTHLFILDNALNDPDSTYDDLKWAYPYIVSILCCVLVDANNARVIIAEDKIMVSLAITNSVHRAFDPYLLTKNLINSKQSLFQYYHNLI